MNCNLQTQSRLSGQLPPDLAGPAHGVQVLMNLTTGYWQAATLSAAVELGVFPCISKSAATAAEIAHECEADLACMADLLNALVGLGMLEKEGKIYRLNAEFDPTCARTVQPACWAR